MVLMGESGSVAMFSGRRKLLFFFSLFSLDAYSYESKGKEGLTACRSS